MLDGPSFCNVTRVRRCFIRPNGWKRFAGPMATSLWQLLRARRVLILRNAVVFCRVESWLTGRRLVSLPFSDHCDMLVDTAVDLDAITSALEIEVCQRKLRYAEIRTTQTLDTSSLGSHSIHTCCLHQIDLQPNLDIAL